MDGNNGMSVADVMALRNDDNGFGGDNSIWLLFFFFLLFFNGNGYGGGSSAVTRADLAQSFDFNNLGRQVQDISASICGLHSALDHCCLVT